MTAVLMASWSLGPLWLLVLLTLGLAPWVGLVPRRLATAVLTAGALAWFVWPEIYYNARCGWEWFFCF